MKKIAWLLVCLAVVTLGSVAVQANDGKVPLRAEVPFAFSIQNVSYRPGSYTFYEEHGILYVVNDHDKTEKAFLVVPSDPATNLASSQLGFTNVNGTRYLTKIWSPRFDRGVEVIYKNKAAGAFYTAAGSR